MREGEVENQEMNSKTGSEKGEQKIEDRRTTGENQCARACVLEKVSGIAEPTKYVG
jgi:hypothetical protein